MAGQIKGWKSVRAFRMGGAWAATGKKESGGCGFPHNIDGAEGDFSARWPFLPHALLFSRKVNGESRAFSQLAFLYVNMAVVIFLHDALG